MQELPADAAANVYCLTELSTVLRQLGNHGYRVELSPDLPTGRVVKLVGVGGPLQQLPEALRSGRKGLQTSDRQPRRPITS